MPRSGEQVRARLQQAAVDLFLERGFDAVTTAQIAERAGVTERTYFRHFADKREVLFDGEALLIEALTASITAAPAGEAPMATLLGAFRSIVALLERNRPVAEPRAVVITATPALRERALAKDAHLVEVLVEALRARGVDDEVAALAVEVGWATLRHAMRRWMAGPPGGLAPALERAFDQLRAVVGGGVGS
jgi:AcrR family transcriptional regulator